MNENPNNRNIRPGQGVNNPTPQGAPSQRPQMPPKAPGSASGENPRSKPQGNPQRPRDESVNWGAEIKNAGRIAAKVSLRVLSYIFNVLITVLLVGVITGMIVGTAFIIYINNCIDPEVDMSLFAIDKDRTTTIYYTEYTDRENRIGEEVELEDQRLYGAENSLWAEYEDMPKDLIYAFVSIEDRRFFTHDGVDWLRTGSAVLNFLFPQGRLYGASTITQQLIKNITGDDDVTIQRKIQEIVRALNIEKYKSKEEIIEMYLNFVYLSQNCYGVQTAANTYFNKDVSDLTLVECAALAAIVQSPTAFDPYTRPERNKDRREEVLKNMLEYEHISQEEYDEAINTELVINLNKRSDANVSTNSWFTDTLIDDVINDLMREKGYTRAVASNLIYSGGLKIYSTVDPEVQKVLEEEYAKESNFPETTGIKPESAMVVIDPPTGDILGIVGGRDKVGNRVQNHATQSTRPPGSSLKPISTYGPGLEYGILTYATIYDDVPVNFGDYTVDPDPEMPEEEIVEPDPWPNNYPDRYGGLTTVADALRRSVNTVSVRILGDLTIDRSFDFVYNKLNCKSLIEGRRLESGRYVTDKGVAALALGQLEYGITVRELTSAYSMIANGGIYCESHTYIKVLDSNGEVLLSNEELGTTVMSEQNTFILTKMMQAVVSSGTATSITLDEKVNVAGKTGTTNSDYDRWFVGFTPYYVGGVWLGYEYPKSLTGISTSAHVRLWDAVMTRLHEDIINDAKNGGAPIKEFNASGVIEAEFCTASGKIPTEACRLDPRGTSTTIATGYFTASTLPLEPCDCHVKVAVCKESGMLLGPDCNQNASNIEYRGLIKEELRSFPIEVPVVDAQYVYREMAYDVLPGGEGEPFFQNTLDEEEYVGKTEDVDVPMNQYCTVHFNLEAFNKRAAGITDDTTAETTAPTTTNSPTVRPPWSRPVETTAKQENLYPVRDNDNDDGEDE